MDMLVMHDLMGAVSGGRSLGERRRKNACKLRSQHDHKQYADETTQSS